MLRPWSTCMRGCLPRVKVCTTVHGMTRHTEGGTGNDATSLLAREFARRISVLGLSRRQLTEMSGLSRQTLHNIEHGARTDLKPATLRALDNALLWRPGTDMALAKGDASVLADADTTVIDVRENAYRWTVVEKIQRMSLEDLERLVSIMERETLGATESLGTDDVVSRVEANVMRLVDKRLHALLGDAGGNVGNGET